MDADFRQPLLDFRLQDMGVIYNASEGKQDELHRHNYFTILIVDEASGRHSIDNEVYEFGSRQIHFVSPGQIHQVILDTKPKGSAITFSEDFLIENDIPLSFISNINLFQEFGNTPPLHVSNALFHRLRTIVTEMASCSSDSLSFRKRALGALLQLFLIYCKGWNTC